LHKFALEGFVFFRENALLTQTFAIIFLQPGAEISPQIFFFFFFLFKIKALSLLSHSSSFLFQSATANGDGDGESQSWTGSGTFPARTAGDLALCRPGSSRSPA